MGGRDSLLQRSGLSKVIHAPVGRLTPMCLWVILASLRGLKKKKEAMVLTGGCGEGILGGLGGGKGEGGYDQNTVLACAKFSKSTLKYILRCKLRRPENGKRGGNKSPPSRNH